MDVECAYCSNGLHFPDRTLCICPQCGREVFVLGTPSHGRTEAALYRMVIEWASEKMSGVEALKLRKMFPHMRLLTPGQIQSRYPVSNYVTEGAPKDEAVAWLERARELGLNARLVDGSDHSGKDEARED